MAHPTLGAWHCIYNSCTTNEIQFISLYTLLGGIPIPQHEPKSKLILSSIYPSRLSRLFHKQSQNLTRRRFTQKMRPLESSPKHTQLYLPNRYTSSDTNTIDTESAERTVPSLPLPNPKGRRRLALHSKAKSNSIESGLATSYFERKEFMPFFYT